MVDSNGLPGKELLTKDVIIITKEDDMKLVTISVKDQNIVIESNAFFVSIQRLSTRKERLFIVPEIYETYRNKKLLTYRRNLGKNNNNWYGWFKKEIVFFAGGTIPSNDTSINVLAYAKIEFFEKQINL